MNSRLLSLDVLRGMTIAGMIVVNNGAGGTCFTPLEHAEWNGLTPCDLVFPFFLFMVGVSIAFALGKYSPASEDELAKQPALRKIMVRTLKMFLIGVLLNASGQLLKGIPLYETLATLRILGILQRIALCYGLASLLTLWVQPRHFWKIIISLLVLYGIVLLLTGSLMCVAGILLGGFAILLSAIGFFVLLAGLNNAYQGYHHHTVEEKQD